MHVRRRPVSVRSVVRRRPVLATHVRRRPVSVRSVVRRWHTMAAAVTATAVVPVVHTPGNTVQRPGGFAPAPLETRLVLPPPAAVPFEPAPPGSRFLNLLKVCLLFLRQLQKLL